MDPILGGPETPLLPPRGGARIQHTVALFSYSSSLVTCQLLIRNLTAFSCRFGRVAPW